jgi:hypothetical protein
MTPQELERSAMIALRTDNSYEGGSKNLDVLAMADDEVNFDGNSRSIASELQNGVVFGFKIANSTGSTKVLALSAASFNVIGVASVTDTVDGSTGTHLHTVTNTISYKSATEISAAGITCDYVLDDGTLEANLTVTALKSAFTVRRFMNFIRRNPQRVPEIVISADNKSAFEEIMTIARVSPYRTFGENNIQLSDFFSPDQFQSTKIIVPTPELQLDDQTVVLLPVANGRTLTITLKIGANKNSARSLNKKASRALSFIRG